MDAKVKGDLVTVRGVKYMPSGDVSFYAQNRAHQKWLMDNKHLWSKQFHPDLEATPSTYSVMVQGVPKTFDVTSKTLLARLASESNFKASEVARLRWMGSNSALEKKKKAGSIVISFLNEDLALRIERAGIFNKYEFHRTERFKTGPLQCYKCLHMGHYRKWC